MGRRMDLPLITAAACLVGLVLVGLFGLVWPAGHARDSAILYGFSLLWRDSTDEPLRIIARIPDPIPYAFLGSLCIGVALLRRRPSRAVAVAVLLLGTGATTQMLKHVLNAPRISQWLGPWGQVGDNSWPSGHSTAAMTLALCAVMVAPPAQRALVALFAAAIAVISSETASAGSCDETNCGSRAVKKTPALGLSRLHNRPWRKGDPARAGSSGRSAPAWRMA